MYVYLNTTNCSELYTRECLDSFLSRALDVPLNKEGRLSIVDECQYVLTLDFALKVRIQY